MFILIQKHVSSTNHAGKLALGEEKPFFILGWVALQPDKAVSVIVRIRDTRSDRAAYLGETEPGKSQEKTGQRQNLTLPC